jgi:hypothetical protein
MSIAKLSRSLDERAPQGSDGNPPSAARPCSMDAGNAWHCGSGMHGLRKSSFVVGMLPS